MSETGQLLAGKKAITPLWIVALFVSLTETVLGVAVTQTLGGIQIALTAFVIGFPLLIAGSFFAILWKKPYVFYPPTEFGSDTKVRDYVEAMQLRPGFLGGFSEVQAIDPPTGKELEAVDRIAERFLARIAINALLYVYAFSLAHSNGKIINFYDLNAKIRFPLTDTYGMGILSAASATGLVTYKKHKAADVAPDFPEIRRFKYLAEITDVNEKLKSKLPGGFEERLRIMEKEGEVAPDNGFEAYRSWINERLALIEEYFSN